MCSLPTNHRVGFRLKHYNIFGRRYIRQGGSFRNFVAISTSQRLPRLLRRVASHADCGKAHPFLGWRIGKASHLKSGHTATQPVSSFSSHREALRKFGLGLPFWGFMAGSNIAPDHRYKLVHECIVTQFDIIEEDASTQTEQRGPPSVDESADTQKGIPPISIDPKLLEAPPDETSARKCLASCPHFPQAVGPQHGHIRLEEQSQFELELRKSRCIWLAADWGIGKDGFLASGIQRFRTADLTPEVFHIKCDEASNIDALEALFPQQCGMPLQAFCGFLAALKGAFLVLDEIDTAICRGEQLMRLNRITTAILDYCPDLRLILLSRLLPDNCIFSSLELRPLEVPDVRTYLLHHPDAAPELVEADTVEALHFSVGWFAYALRQNAKGIKSVFHCICIGRGNGTISCVANAVRKRSESTNPCSRNFSRSRKTKVANAAFDS